MLSLFAHILSVLLRCHKPQDVWQILDIITEPYSLYIHISWNIYSALNFITSWYFGPLSNVDHVQHLNSLVLVLQVQTSLRYPQMKDCTHTSQCPWIHSWKNTCTELLKYSKNVRVYHHMHSQWSQVLGKSVWRSLFSSFQRLHQQWSRARSTPPMQENTVYCTSHSILASQEADHNDMPSVHIITLNITLFWR